MSLKIHKKAPQGAFFIDIKSLSYAHQVDYMALALWR